MMSNFTKAVKYSCGTNAFNRIIKTYPFELFIGICLFFYTVFYFTPSSYGLVFSTLGMNREGLYLGKPQAIRSDEWAVWTPYLQALVTNNFERFNKLSIYHEDFRNFNALPIYDWGLLFKPQFWSFLLMEPARAFSFHHGFLIAAFLIGWKRFVERLIGKYRFASQSSCIFFSFLLFFSSFVQVWLTTLGPLLAFFPWLLIVIFSWQKNTITYYLTLFYIATVWLLSHTYPPIIISSAYFLGGVLMAYQSGFYLNIKRLFFSLLAFIFAIIVTVYYLSDVIMAMMNTVFPGQRVSTGGWVPWKYLPLSVFFPYQYYSHDVSFLKIVNVSEFGLVSSFLPLFVLCFSVFKRVKPQFRHELKFLLFVLLFCVSWMTFPIPEVLAKYMLLTFVSANRMLFVFGLTVNIIALTVLFNVRVILTWYRLLVFSGLLIFFWALPSYQLLPEWYKETDWFDKSALELVVIPMLVVGIILYRYAMLSERNIPAFLLFLAMFGNGLYFADFNPVQSSKPIFEASKSAKLRKLKLKQAHDARGWLISSAAPGAVLSGLGFKSFSHVLIQPQLAFFRKLFPELPEQEFNHIFNRYAHIHIYNGDKIYSPQIDVINIPKKLVVQGLNN